VGLWHANSRDGREMAVPEKQRLGFVVLGGLEPVLNVESRPVDWERALALGFARWGLESPCTCSSIWSSWMEDNVWYGLVKGNSEKRQTDVERKHHEWG
jgi:hypothetical protein